MEKTKTIEEKITRYALIIFAVLMLLIIYTFFTTQSNKTTEPASITTPQAEIQNDDVNKQATQVSASPPVVTKVAQQITPTTETKPLAAALIQKIKKTEKQTEMKPDDYKIPASKKKKLTELLPQDLRDSIQASLPNAEEIATMTPKERAKFKETQKKLAVVLRDIGHTEAENQQLQRSLDNAEVKKQQLNDQLKN